MDQAELYTQINELQRRDAKFILNEYKSAIKWRSDGRDRLLDIGTGSGDVLMDYVYPLLPPKFELLMGSDKSEEMVSFAKKHYSTDERTTFEVLDIATKVLPKHLHEYFDHVTSFYCLHWVQDQLMALRNIYNLLRTDGGDCLLLVLASHFVFDAYELVAKLPKWYPYMYDWQQYMPPLRHNIDPAARLSQLLVQAGFVECKVENRTMIYVFESEQFFRNFIRAVCPFFVRIPIELHTEFLDELVNKVKSMNLCQSDESSNDIKIISNIRMVMAYARKRSGLERNDSEN